MIRKSHLTLMIITVLIALPAHSGKVFKWIDEKGVTHYSSTPPILSDNAETLIIPGEPDETAKPGEMTESEEPANMEDNHSATGEVPNPEAIQYCRQLAENLQVLATNDDVRLEHEDGTYQILNAEGKKKEKARIQKQMEKYCQTTTQMVR